MTGEDPLLEVRVVSRKTKRDGRLEISPATAGRLGRLRVPLPIVTPDGRAEAHLATMECTCVKSGGERHTHHFLESPLLAALAAEHHVRILLDGSGGVRVEPA